MINPFLDNSTWPPVFTGPGLLKLPVPHADKIAILFTMEFEGLSFNGGVGTYYRELARQLIASGWHVILAAVGGQLADMRESRGFGLASMFDVTRCEEFLELRDIHKALLKACGDDGLSELGLKCLFVLQAIEHHFREARVLAEFHDMYGFGYHASKARQAGLLGERVSVAVTMHSGHEWIFHANQAIFSYQAHNFIRIASREEQSFASASLPMYPSDSLRSHVDDYGWDVARAHKMPYFVPVLQDGVARQELGDEPALAKVMPLVFFGRLEERKGLLEFVEAVNSCSGLASSEFKVVFLGKNVHLHSQELSGLTSHDYLKSALAPNVQWEIRSDYSSTEATNFLKSLPRAVICLASPTDNFPNAALEAAQLPFALVVSDTLGFRQTLSLVGRDSGVFWFEPENAGSLAHAIEIALGESAQAVTPPSANNLQLINDNLLRKRLELIKSSFTKSAARQHNHKVFLWVLCDQDISSIDYRIRSLLRFETSGISFGLKFLGSGIDPDWLEDLRRRYPDLVIDAGTGDSGGDWLFRKDFRDLAFHTVLFVRWDVEFTEDGLTKFVNAAFEADAEAFYCAEATPDPSMPIACYDAPNILDILDPRFKPPACIAISSKVAKALAAPKTLRSRDFLEQIFVACLASGFRCGYFAYPLYVVSGQALGGSKKSETNRRMESLAYLGRLPSLGGRCRFQAMLALTQLSMERLDLGNRKLGLRLPGGRQASALLRRMNGLLRRIFARTVMDLF